VNEELNPLTLRFRTYQKEAVFIAQRRATLIWGVKAALIIGTAGTVAVLAHIVSQILFEADDNGQARQVHMVRICLSSAIVITLLLSLAFVCCKRADVIPPVTIELMLTAVVGVVMVSTVVLGKAKMARIMGLDAKDVFGENLYASDSAALLAINACVTALHAEMPVRWHIMFILQIIAILMWATLVMVIGNDEPRGHTVINSVLLTCLIASSSLSKRAIELRERIGFAKLIEEKSMRCKAEFMLANVKDERDPSLLIEVGSEYKPRSEPESHVTSTASGLVFEALHADPLHPHRVDVGASLARVAELGDTEHWRIDEKEVKILPDSRLGFGGFGVVTKGVFCGMLVAVKCPLRRINSANLHMLPELCNELRVMRHLRHPNIIHSHGAIVDPQHYRIALVLELVRGVTLNKFMEHVAEDRDNVEPSALARCQIMLGVCGALVYMHTRSPPVVHGDIKSGNVMVEVFGDHVCPKLLDFGLSRLLTRNPRPMGGTLSWMAPEVLLGNGPVKCSADVYSFGRLIAFLATGISPLSEFPSGQLKEMLAEGPPPLPSWPQQCIFEPSCKALVHSCIQGEEVDRPNSVKIHSVLLELPQELGLSDTTGNFVADAKLLAELAGGVTDQSPWGEPSDKANSEMAVHGPSFESLSYTPLSVSQEAPALQTQPSGESEAEPQQKHKPGLDRGTRECSAYQEIQGALESDLHLQL